MSSITKLLYDAAPTFLQNLAVTAFGWNIRRVRFGADFERLFAEAMDRQWLAEPDLRHYQELKLRELVRHAYENVPYYHRVMAEHKLRPDDIRTRDDLSKLPLLQRETLKYDLDSLLARNTSRSKLFYGETSGTTGDPTSVYWDRQMVIVNAVVEWRQKAWAGLKLGDPIAVIMVARSVVPPRQSEPPFWRYNRAMNQLLMSAFHMKDDTLDHYVRELQRFRPVALEAYPSTALRLARYILDKGIELPIPIVLTTSEALHPGHRPTIEQAFGCQVFDYYGMAERIVFATECEQHTGFHLNLDYGITEILDINNQSVPPGTPGRVVGTGLHNFAMPLIRLATTDTVAMSVTTCSCGRSFPLLSDFCGRIDDYLMTPDGRLLPAAGLTVITDEISRLAESQILQQEPGRIQVKIVKGKGYSDDDTRTLLTNCRKILGDEMKIELEFVPEIPSSKSGKHRWIVSNVKWDQ